MPQFSSLPLPANLAIFAAGAAVVWFAGTKVARYASTLSARTRLSKALVGTVLLGGITSLPEIATTGTASLSGNAPLAVNNLLGGVAMQVAVLAIADAAIGRDALSSVVARPVVLLQGTLNILLLGMIAMGIASGDVAVAGIGAWSGAILLAYIGAITLLARSRASTAWQARQLAQSEARTRSKTPEERRSTGRIALYTALAGAAILVGGFLVARTGEALAEQTGLGASFVGAVLVAIATSLPEVSSTVAAVRLGQYELAFADIFGTNLFDLALVTLADAGYGGGPVLNQVGRFSIFAALLGIAVTAIYLGGLIERRDRVVLRMGVDSAMVLVVYLGGLVVLYGLRG